MKRIVLIAIAVVSMALTSYASDVNTPVPNGNDDNTGFVAKNGDRHTQEYLDYKKVLDEYEKDINAASSCDELSGAQFGLLLNVMAFVKEEYDESEQMTDEENALLSQQAERIDQLIKKKQNQWGCEVEEEEYIEPAGDYMEVMSLLDGLESSIDDAKTCDDLNRAVEFFLEFSDEIDGSTFTDEEAKAFEEKSTIVGEKLSAKADQLCN